MEAAQRTIFYVAAHGSEGHDDFNWNCPAITPQEALEFSISKLPSGWVGNIEVTDDETNHPFEMPLIDYWKEN